MDAPARAIVLLPHAAFEMDAAFGWYENQREGLGTEYLRAVDAAFALIARQPGLHRVVRGRIRRAVLRRFPYGVFFVDTAETVTILAVLHIRRSDENWPSEPDV
jgi:toxin ParE1/3/4